MVARLTPGQVTYKPPSGPLLNPALTQQKGPEHLQRELEKERTTKRELSRQLRAQEDFHKRCVALLRQSRELQERQAAVLARAEGPLEGPLQEVQNRPRSKVDRKYRGRSGSRSRHN